MLDLVFCFFYAPTTTSLRYGRNSKKETTASRPKCQKNNCDFLKPSVLFAIKEPGRVRRIRTYAMRLRVRTRIRIRIRVS